MKEIALSRGHVALVDDSDFDWLTKSSWYYSWSKGVGYASRRFRNRLLAMHVAIWEHHFGAVPAGLEIDHANRNSLDNRKRNLRLLNHALNAANRGTQSNNKLGVKGVYRERGKFRARITRNGTRVGLGLFETVEEAAAAYALAERQYLAIPTVC